MVAASDLRGGVVRTFSLYRHGSVILAAGFGAVASVAFRCGQRAAFILRKACFEAVKRQLLHGESCPSGKLPGVHW